MTLEGVDDAIRKLEEAIQKERRRAAVCWWDTIQQTVFVPSLGEVPVKTGDLKSTGQNELVIEPGAISCDVGYGSEAINYAWVQHERLDFHHPQTGKAKYLEDPVNAAIPIIPGEFQKRMYGGG